METHTALHSLRTAVPYIRAYKGRVFVLKTGGGLCEPGAVLENIVDQVAVFHQLGIQVVLVHGGGEQVSEMSRRLGLTPQMVAGRRVTDAATLEVTKMVLGGTVNTNVLAAFRKSGVPAIGLSGVDGGLISAKRRPPVEVSDPATGKSRQVDYGLVGDIVQVDVKPLQHLMAGGFVPVVCSLAADAQGQVYNVNADTVASRIAVEIRAAKYFSLTTVDGVLEKVDDASTLHSYLDVAEVEAMVRSGAVSGGMLPKLAACIDALRGGVPRVHVVNGAVRDTLLAEVFTNEGCGSLIVTERERGRAAEPGPVLA